LTYKVVFSPEAENDLLELYLYIAEQAGDARALAYVERLERYCKGFEEFPERGTSRDDLFPGLRIVGFEHRVSIAFHVNADTVTFDRILYGGRDLESLADDT